MAAVPTRMHQDEEHEGDNPEPVVSKEFHVQIRSRARRHGAASGARALLGAV